MQNVMSNLFYHYHLSNVFINFHFFYTYILSAPSFGDPKVSQSVSIVVRPLRSMKFLVMRAYNRNQNIFARRQLFIFFYFQEIHMQGQMTGQWMQKMA